MPNCNLTKMRSKGINLVNRFNRPVEDISPYKLKTSLNWTSKFEGVEKPRKTRRGMRSILDDCH